MSFESHQAVHYLGHQDLYCQWLCTHDCCEKSVPCHLMEDSKMLSSYLTSVRPEVKSISYYICLTFFSSASPPQPVLLLPLFLLLFLLLLLQSFFPSSFTQAFLSQVFSRELQSTRSALMNLPETKVQSSLIRQKHYTQKYAITAAWEVKTPRTSHKAHNRLSSSLH